MLGLHFTNATVLPGPLAVQEAARLGRSHLFALCAAAEALLRMLAATPQQALVVVGSVAASGSPPGTWRDQVFSAARPLTLLASFAGQHGAPAAAGSGLQADPAAAAAQLQALCRLASSALKALQLACLPSGSESSSRGAHSPDPAARQGSGARGTVSSEAIFHATTCLLNAATGAFDIFALLPGRLQAEQLRWGRPRPLAAPV